MIYPSMRLGYHRISDDSISSAWLTREEVDNRIKEIKKDRDINHYWTRDAYMNMLWEEWQ